MKHEGVMCRHHHRAESLVTLCNFVFVPFARDANSLSS